MATFPFVLAYTFVLCVNAASELGNFYQSTQKIVPNVWDDVKGQIDPDVHKNLVCYFMLQYYFFITARSLVVKV